MMITMRRLTIMAMRMTTMISVARTTMHVSAVAAIMTMMTTTVRMTMMTLLLRMLLLVQLTLFYEYAYGCCCGAAECEADGGVWR